MVWESSAVGGGTGHVCRPVTVFTVRLCLCRRFHVDMTVVDGISSQYVAMIWIGRMRLMNK